MENDPNDPHQTFNIDAEVVERGVKALHYTNKLISKDPCTFFTKVFGEMNEEQMSYILEKWQCASFLQMTLQEDSQSVLPISSLAIMMSRRSFPDDKIATLLQHIKTIDGERIKKEEQLACSWIARTFKGACSIVSMEELFESPEKALEMWDLLRTDGFEAFMMQLSTHGVRKCIQWTNDQCERHGHIGYDHERLRLYFKK